jgi:hypothetical protein
MPLSIFEDRHGKSRIKFPSVYVFLKPIVYSKTVRPAFKKDLGTSTGFSQPNFFAKVTYQLSSQRHERSVVGIGNPGANFGWAMVWKLRRKKPISTCA